MTDGGVVDGEQSFPVRRNPDVLMAGAGGATSIADTAEFWPGSSGRPPRTVARDPRSSYDGARVPSAISVTEAGGGFSRPHPASPRSVDRVKLRRWEWQ